MFDLIIIGHLLKERIVFPDGKEVGPVLGSPAAYSSVAGAKLGIKTGLVTKIGKDMPEHFLKVFKEVGVDTQGIKIGKDTTSNFLIYDRSGAKELKFLKKAPEILFKDIPSDYLKAKIFLICPIDYEVPISLLKRLYELNRILIMDAGGYGGASSTRDSKSIEERLNFLKEIAKYFHVIKVAKEDCRYIFGRTFIDVEEAAANFIEWGYKISMVTCGGEGALVVTKTDKFHVPAFTIKVTDPTGAGDVFISGFIAEYYLNNSDIQKSILFAQATASLLIEKTGGVSSLRMPQASEVYSRLKNEINF